MKGKKGVFLGRVIFSLGEENGRVFNMQFASSFFGGTGRKGLGDGEGTVTDDLTGASPQSSTLVD